MKKVIVVALIFSISLVSCKDNHDHDHENELITSVKLTFGDGSNTQSFWFKDTDGEGGNAPTVENINLKPNTEYSLKVEFWDESKSPSSNLTSEIVEEAAEHLIVITLSPSSLGQYSYSDKDVNGFPLGIDGILKTTAAGNGTLKVQLRHQPPINGNRTKNGSAAPGSDDVNVDFPVIIK